MMAKDINCAYCSSTGYIDACDQDLNELQTKFFKHQGHDPFTGQLYYKCPYCLMTLQVDPMDVLKGEVLKGVPSGVGQRHSSHQTIYYHFSHLRS
jgi:hypothetical protein